MSFNSDWGFDPDGVMKAHVWNKSGGRVFRLEMYKEYLKIAMTRAPLLAKFLFTFVSLAIFGSSAAAQATQSACDDNIQNSSVAISPDGLTAVASCSQRSEVIVYDLYAQKVRRVLDQFVVPRKILFEPTGRYFYISDSVLGVVEKIDTVSLQTVSVLYAIPGAFGMTMSNDGRTLYVNNASSTIIAVFDLVSEHRIAQITAYSGEPHEASPEQDGPFLYLADFWEQKISILDTRTNQITGEISGFSKICALSVIRDGKTLLVVDGGTQSIAVVDLFSRATVINIPIGSGSGDLAISRDQRFVYSYDPRHNSLAVVALLPSHGATNPGFLETAQGIVFSRDGSAAYVLGRDLSISRVNLSNKRIVYTIAPRSGTRVAQRLQPVKKRSGDWSGD
jgi:DNA-binding beta-propeller fold protein YncE